MPEQQFAWLCSPDAPVTTAVALETAPLISQERDRFRWPRGTPVEARNHFDGRWVGGFIVEASEPGESYRLRRRSDQAVLPVAFASDELRPASS
jgi:hypothetical protein